ncbi:hypothetical protein [Xanthomonas sp. XNM01]|uniref:hypothetical protein n=1 Tax=Xanthomonas sp. XNM01 TaxID=2769289 RepID=UPI00177EDC91|nr:hypothetical protein [Xanthomonas sp. XNM01]MBD9368109.1 hypothetical protein [Xanthomonas sp. XNM01]
MTASVHARLHGRRIAPGAAWACLALLPLLAACGAPEPPASTPPEVPATSASAPPPPDAQRPAPAASTPAARQWRCGEETVSLRSDTARGVLILTHARGELELPTAGASDGTHADGNGNAFDERDGSARLTLSGQPPRDCTPGEAQATP